MFVFVVSVSLTVGYVAFVDVPSVYNPGGHGDVICVGVFVCSVADIRRTSWLQSHTHTDN